MLTGDLVGIGEKLWEGNGKTQLMTVQEVNADGVTVEFTWSGDLIGVGHAKGVNGTIVFTGRKLATISGPGKGSTKGQGILFAKGGLVAIKSTGYGNPKWENTKSVEIWNFLTASHKLNWLNDTVALVTQEGDPSWKEFKITINEWK
jgi:hypothetical protein